MAVMRRESPSGMVRMRPEPQPQRRGSAWSHPISTALLGALSMVIAYQLLSGAMVWAHVKVDDLRYGYPRSYQTEGYIGFGESNGLPTHFVALNLHRQVEVLIVAGDDPSHVMTLKGPTLFDANDEYNPVTLRLVDVNNDGYPDLVLTVANQQVVWINQPRVGQFRAMKPTERLAVARAVGGTL